MKILGTKHHRARRTGAAFAAVVAAVAVSGFTVTSCNVCADSSISFSSQPVGPWNPNGPDAPEWVSPGNPPNAYAAPIIEDEPGVGRVVSLQGGDVNAATPVDHSSGSYWAANLTGVAGFGDSTHATIIDTVTITSSTWTVGTASLTPIVSGPLKPTATGMHLVELHFVFDGSVAVVVDGANVYQAPAGTVDVASGAYWGGLEGYVTGQTRATDITVGCDLNHPIPT